MLPDRNQIIVVLAKDINCLEGMKQLAIKMIAAQSRSNYGNARRPWCFLHQKPGARAVIYSGRWR